MTTNLTAKQIDHIATAPLLSRTIVQRALEATASPRQAIKAKSLTCCNYQRSAISDCTVRICPLWAYRPYTAKSVKTADE